MTWYSYDDEVFFSEEKDVEKVDIYMSYAIVILLFGRAYRLIGKLPARYMEEIVELPAR